MFEDALRMNSMVADRQLNSARRTRTLLPYLKHALAMMTNGCTMTLFSH
jgi:hypothetical protein